MSRARSLAGAGAPVLGLHGGLDGRDVSAAAGPRGLAALVALDREAHDAESWGKLLKGLLHERSYNRNAALGA